MSAYLSCYLHLQKYKVWDRLIPRHSISTIVQNVRLHLIFESKHTYNRWNNYLTSLEMQRVWYTVTRSTYLYCVPLELTFSQIFVVLYLAMIFHFNAIFVHFSNFFKLYLLFVFLICFYNEIHVFGLLGSQEGHLLLAFDFWIGVAFLSWVVELYLSLKSTLLPMSTTNYFLY